MRQFQYILFLLFCLCIINACRNDFDELNDTDQRHMLFTFNTDSLFTNLLKYNGEYYLPRIDSLSSDYCVRITAYCYDTKGHLLQSQKLLTPLNTKPQMKIRHIFKETSYRFAFIADVVKYDTQVDYYETWFQLGTNSWRTFYLYADNRHDDAMYDVVGLYTSIMEPDNQNIEILFQPITYNVFFVFTKLQSVDHLSGYLFPVISFNVRTLKWTRAASSPYEFDYRNPNEDIIYPLSLSYADSIITAQIITNKLSGKDTTSFPIHNPNRRPFVAIIDCDSLVLRETKFY